MSGPAVFTAEAVKGILSSLGFTEYDGDKPAEVGFEVFKAAFGPDIIVAQQPLSYLMKYNPGEGPRALVSEYLEALDKAGYVVRSTGSNVVVAGVKR